MISFLKKNLLICISILLLTSALPHNAKATNDPVKLGIGIPLLVLASCFSVATAAFTAWYIHEKKNPGQFGDCSGIAACLAGSSGITAAAMFAGGIYLTSTANEN